MTLATSRPSATGTECQQVAAGLDGGAGSTKLVISDHSVRCPSYLLYLSSDNYEVESVEDGGMVEYLEGERADLRGVRWIGGSTAAKTDPLRMLRVGDEARGKLQHGLQTALICLATLPHKSVWNISLIASIQDAQTYGKELKKLLQGAHVVRFNKGAQSLVNLQVQGVAEEGQGCVVAAHIDPQSTVLLFDFGSRNLTVSVFGKGGKLLNRELTLHGVNLLIDAIAKDPRTREALVDEIDRHVLRQGIESRLFRYGKRGFDFQQIYLDHLAPWANKAMVEIERIAGSRMHSADVLLAAGGGSQLPRFQRNLIEKSIQPVEDGAIANAMGLRAIAQSRLQRGISNG